MRSWYLSISIKVSVIFDINNSGFVYDMMASSRFRAAVTVHDWEAVMCVVDQNAAVYFWCYQFDMTTHHYNSRLSNSQQLLAIGFKVIYFNRSALSILPKTTAICNLILFFSLKCYCKNKGCAVHKKMTLVRISVRFCKNLHFSVQFQFYIINCSFIFFPVQFFKFVCQCHLSFMPVWYDARNDKLPCWIGPTNCQPKWLRTRSAWRKILRLWIL